MPEGIREASGATDSSTRGAWPSHLTRGLETEASSDVDQLRQRARAHLAHHPPAMGFHGDLADTELAAHLLVELAGHHESHHFLFAATERSVTATEQLQSGCFVQRD